MRIRGLRPGIPIERGHAFRSKAATCSDEGGRGVRRPTNARQSRKQPRNLSKTLRSYSISR
jgi:hypothetical protein